MFLHQCVILFTGHMTRRRGSLSGSLCPGGLCLGGLCPRGLCPGGLCSEGSGGLSRGVWGVYQGLSVSRGVCPMASLSGGSLVGRQTPNEQAVPVSQLTDTWLSMMTKFSF